MAAGSLRMSFRKNPATARQPSGPEHGPVGPVIPGMAQSFGGGLQMVEVTTDELVRGLPKKQLWVAAAKREQAITLVLAEIPEGWTAVLLDAQLKPEEAAFLKLRPGDVRRVTR
jgi:hypothetical protein